MSEAPKADHGEVVVSEIDVLGSLKRMKILGESQTLTPEEDANVLEGAMVLLAEDPNIDPEIAITIAYLEIIGVEAISRMNIDRFAFLLEDVTGHAWEKGEAQETLEYIKNAAKTNTSFMKALSTLEARGKKNASTDRATQGVLNNRGEVLAVGNDRTEVLRKALSERGLK